LNQEDISHLNRCKSSNEIKAPIKIVPSKKSLGPERFSAEFYQIFEEHQLSPNFSMNYKGKGHCQIMKPRLQSSQNRTRTQRQQNYIIFSFFFCLLQIGGEENRSYPRGLVPVEGERRTGKGGRRVYKLQKRVHMYESAKMITVETIPRMEGRGNKTRVVEGMNSSMINLILF
jgi:hypothetical protein